MGQRIGGGAPSGKIKNARERIATEPEGAKRPSGGRVREGVSPLPG